MTKRSTSTIKQGNLHIFHHIYISQTETDRRENDDETGEDDNQQSNIRWAGGGSPQLGAPDKTDKNKYIRCLFLKRMYFCPLLIFVHNILLCYNILFFVLVSSCVSCPVFSCLILSALLFSCLPLLVSSFFGLSIRLLSAVAVETERARYAAKRVVLSVMQEVADSPSVVLHQHEDDENTQKHLELAPFVNLQPPVQPWRSASTIISQFDDFIDMMVSNPPLPHTSIIVVVRLKSLLLHAPSPPPKHTHISPAMRRRRGVI